MMDDNPIYTPPGQTRYWHVAALCVLLSIAFISISQPAFAAQTCNAIIPSNAGVLERVLKTIESVLQCTTRILFDSLAAWVVGPLKAAIVLAVTFFGIAFVSGLIQLNAKEFMVLLFKIGLVWTFATQSTYAIDLAMNFFIDFAREGSEMVWTASGAAGSAKASISGIADNKLNSIMSIGSNTSTFAPNFPASCWASIFTLLLLVVIFMPAVLLFVFLFIWNFVILYATAILYYFKSIVMISFLIVLSPIFVSFALFQRTRELFEIWVKNLVTASLQMVVMFAFLAMISLVNYYDFFNQLANIIRIYKPPGAGALNTLTSTMGMGAFSLDAGFCSICEDYTFNPPGSLENIDCKGGKDSGAIPIFFLPLQLDFWLWVLSKVVALMVLSKLLEDFLKRAPDISQQLGGVRFGGLMSAGAGSPGFVGYSNPLFRAIENAGLAFKRQYKESARTGLFYLQNPIRTLPAMRDAIKASWSGIDEDSLSRTKEIAPYTQRVKNYSKEALKAKRERIDAEGKLNSYRQQYANGTIPRAVLVDMENRYKLTQANEKRWQRKLSEAELEKRKEMDKIRRTKGGIGFKDSLKMDMDIIGTEYRNLIENPRRRAEYSDSFFFLPTDQDDFDENERFGRDGLDEAALRQYAHEQIQEIKDKLDLIKKDPNTTLNQYDFDRIEKAIKDADDALKSKQTDSIVAAMDNLHHVTQILPQ